jgi:nucleotide-binding universal stress UspA family protein
MRILVGVDFSKSSEFAVEEVARRPWPAGSEIRLVTVVEPLDVAASETFVPDFIETKTQTARVRIESMAARIAERGFPISAAVIPGYPRSALNDAAARWGADLVVVGSRGYGFFRRLPIGSVAAAVVRGAPCSVEVARSGPGGRRRTPGIRVLLATDGSRYSLDAVGQIARRPWPDGSRLRVVSVAEPVRAPWAVPSQKQSRLDRASRQEARRAVEAARQSLKRSALPLSAAVLAGDPKSCLVEECRRWKASLLVVASRGRHGLDRLLLGSVSETVAVHAPCSVEVVRKLRQANAPSAPRW